MTEEMPQKYASPACFLAEADAAYMGWLAPDALDQALAELLRLAPDAARRQALQALRPDIQAEHAPDAAAFTEKLGQLLPRVRDDGLHAALKRLRA